MNFFSRWFSNVVSAIVYAIIYDLEIHSPHANRNAVTRFVIEQHARMPSYLRLALFIITLFFDVCGILFSFSLFHSGNIDKRVVLLNRCRLSKMGVLKDFIKFYYSLVIVAWTDPFTVVSVGEDPVILPDKNQQLKEQSKEFDVIVLGGGPGGAITATLLAEAGFTVGLVEEGRNLPLQSAVSFTVQEMVQKYRNGGLTPALGKPKITYVEGKCIGGGSEINSGLYHRTPKEILAHWKKIYQLKDVDEEYMTEHFEASEKDLSVSLIEGGEAPKASLMLKKGADELGWECMEVPRWVSYEKDGHGKISKGQRRSMTQTYFPRYANAGGSIIHSTRALSVKKTQTGWLIYTRDANQKSNELRCKHLFIACGAIGTPALLKRSGLAGIYGKSLQVHPTIKITALFDEEVNNENMGVPVHQVKEFAPAFSFGCSISSVPYLHLAMLDHPEEVSLVDHSWRKMAIYYAMIVPEGKGSVTQLPFFSDPLVTYQLTKQDLRHLAEATKKLAELLFAAGAKKLFPSVSGMQPLQHKDDLQRMPQSLPRSSSNLMTIHLFSTCPMGENERLCTVDSYGKMRGYNNLYICDASILPTAPGVNPQGSIMAFAQRNAKYFIKENAKN